MEDYLSNVTLKDVPFEKNGNHYSSKLESGQDFSI